MIQRKIQQFLRRAILLRCRTLSWYMDAPGTLEIGTELLDGAGLGKAVECGSRGRLSTDKEHQRHWVAEFLVR
jgi:hypothetical protein